MYIILDETDAPDAADRETAIRIISQIITDDTFSRGKFVIEGYVAARRIAQALTAARRDERSKGFDTPYRMRKTRPAPGSRAVMAKWPDIRPLYHWIEVSGIRLQSYRGAWNKTVMFSDDGRISVEQMADFWIARIDYVPVIGCGAARQFDTAEEAVKAAMERLADGLD